MFATSAPGVGLRRVSVAGGEPEIVTELARGDSETAYWWPDVLPNGKAVLFTVLHGSGQDSHIALLSFETGDVRTLIPGGAVPASRRADTSCISLRGRYGR